MVAADRTAGQLASRRRLRIRRSQVLWTIVALQFVLVAGFGLVRHATFNSGAFDLGIFDQVVWNSAYGRLFANTLSESPNFLGQRLSPILLLLAPVVWLGGGAAGLIVVQAALLTLPVLPIARYSFGRIPGWAALVVPIGYLAHPTLLATASFDFHEVAVAPLLIAIALTGLLLARPMPFYVASILLLFVREDFGIVVAGYALWAVWQRRWWPALILAAAGLTWTALAVLVVIPSFRESGGYDYLWRFGALGSTPDDVAATVATDPGAIAGTVFAPRKLRFLGELIVSFAALPLFAPATLLLVVPILSYLLLGQYRPLTEIVSHYPVTLLPPLALAAVDGLVWLRRRWERAFVWLPWAAVTIMLVVAGGYAVNIGQRRLSNGLAGDPEHIAAASRLLATIPPDASVSAQTGLVPHLSNRERIYLFPRLDDADWVALDTRGQRFAPLGSITYEEGLDELLCDRTFGPVFEEDGLLLFRRGAAPAAFVDTPPASAARAPIRFDDGFSLVGVEVPRATIRRGEVPRVALYWRADRTPSRNWTVFVHLVDSRGVVWGQYDAPPLCGEAPTSTWTTGRILRDDYWVIPRAGIPAGDYRLVMGLYDPGGGARPLADGRETVDLGPVTVQ